MKLCAACGMACGPAEYHPYAACLMFMACHNSATVRANLAAVEEYGAASASREAAQAPVGAVPAGWKLVPINPTVEMLNTWAMDMPEPAFKDADVTKRVLGWEAVHNIWHDMLGAAPVAPQAPESKDAQP